MYNRFKLEIDLKANDYSEYLEEGETMQNKHKKNAGEIIDQFINKGNALDGEAIKNNWFPKIEADIFLSHSHADHKYATAFSGWLHHEFGLRTFIDANVWGHAERLKKKLAIKFCHIKKTNNFRYNDFSHASSHVDIMLAAALASMIDNCECLFFMNSPNATLSYEKEDKTKSAWIYAELFFANLMQRKPPIRMVTEAANESKGLSGFEITHSVDLSNFNELSIEDLKTWLKRKNPDEHKLDTLYNMFPTKIQHRLLN